MSDQDDEKKIVNEESSQSNDENQPKIDSNDSTNPEESSNIETTSEGNENKDQNVDQNQDSVPDNTTNDKDSGSGHQVIHKKDGRLHIYVRQDKYKGELKSKNWVGRLYIDGKQKISSSGTTNLAIYWYQVLRLYSDYLGLNKHLIIHQNRLIPSKLGTLCTNTKTHMLLIGI